MSILIVDDNKEIIDLLLPRLNKEGYDVDVAYNGIEALSIFDPIKHSLILLDIMMPKMDGLTTCKKVREISNVPIIIITAKPEDEDLVIGIDAGADDYIVKPFSLNKVVAKIKAMARRLNINKIEEKIIKIDNLLIDMDKYVCKIDSETVNLTKKEIEILYLMAKNIGRIYSREMLLNMLWGEDYYGDYRTVDTHIKRIRAKMNINNGQYNWDIQTVWGVGYKFERKNKK